MVLDYFKNDLIGIKTVDVYTDNPHVAFIMKYPEGVRAQGSLIPRLLSNISFLQFQSKLTNSREKAWTLVDQLSRGTAHYLIPARNVAELVRPQDEALDPGNLILAADTIAKRLEIDGIPIISPFSHFGRLKQSKHKYLIAMPGRLSKKSIDPSNSHCLKHSTKLVI